MPFVNELLKYTNDVFVETGTYRGDTLEFVRKSNTFQFLHSIELSESFYKTCANRFLNDKNVNIYQGNSRYDLTNIIQSMDKEITFWLDSHWSGGHVDIGCDPELKCPVLHELEQIKNHPIKTHTIMVNDIRLMDGSHFEVTLSQLCKKIMEINPNYQLVFYNDECAEKDILVAHIPICIHSYLNVCSTNPQPPGLADFLRGTISLFQKCKTYHYTLLLNHHHPIFNYIQPHPKLTSKQHNHVYEFIPSHNISYEDIDKNLNTIFTKYQSFSCISNAFYTRVGNNIYNWGEIPLDCKQFLKEMFIPNDEMTTYIKHIFDILQIDCMRPYKVIHLRFGDNYIHNGIFDQNKCNMFCEKIKNMIDNSQYMLITDSDEMGCAIKTKIPELFYYSNKKIHLGDLKSLDKMNGIKDTMADFFILSKAETIYSNGSGFSTFNSLLYDINYILI